VSAASPISTVTESIQPPVLSDRGLIDFIQALALEVALPVTVAGRGPVR
jgi:hypothetical protein